MDLVKDYGNIIKKYIDNPEKTLKLIKFGLSMEEFRVTKFPDKNAPPSLQYLNQICLNFILEPLRHPESYAWVNLFCPTEILHAFNISPMVVEAFSSFSSGLKCEDCLIDCAEKTGISETLCGYHKAFIGAVSSKVLPKPKFALTSTMVCDANVNTFRYVTDMYDVPCYIIDVPYEYTKDGEYYVAEQLKEAVTMIEDTTGKKLDENKLKEVLMRENSSKKYMKQYISGLGKNYFPSTLTLQMYMLFTSHTFMGREETLNFYRMLVNDVKNCSSKEGMRILWVHIMPFYHQALKDYFNFNSNYQLIGYDMHFDSLDYMDVEHPFEAIAKKLMQNKLNGKFERKTQLILDMVDSLEPDAVINFCHWGCRQSSGGVMLLKDALRERNIPFLSLDGDGVDRRSSHEGQIRTRLEAFFEILNNNKV